MTTISGKKGIKRVYPQDIRDYASWDTSYLHTEFPPIVDVLTIHGLADDTIPSYAARMPETLRLGLEEIFHSFPPRFDAVLHARIFSNRPSGTHVLHYIENADHNFAGVSALLSTVVHSGN